MSPYYKQDYTKEYIAEILGRIKACVKQNHYTIAINTKRKENSAFMMEYNLRSYKQKGMILKLKVDDFCYTLQNTKQGYEDETLYVFSPQATLYGADGEAEIVDVYMKFNILQTSSRTQVVVVSFHKQNKPIYYAFR